MKNFLLELANKIYWKIFFQIKKLNSIFKIKVNIPLVEVISYAKKIKRNVDIVIIDDIFPHPLSAFRIAEFNAYLKNFPESSLIYSTATAFKIIGETKTFNQILGEYEQSNPEFSGKVFKMPSYFIFESSKFSYKFQPFLPFECKLIYFVFLGNTYTHIDLIEAYKTPFIFTLYPGGGFQLNQSYSDLMLKRVCDSKYLKKIIVTQKISREYLENI